MLSFFTVTKMVVPEGNMPSGQGSPITQVMPSFSGNLHFFTNFKDFADFSKHLGEVT